MKRSLTHLTALAALAQIPLNSHAEITSVTAADLTYKNCSAKIVSSPAENIAESSDVVITVIGIQITCDDKTSYTAEVHNDSDSLSALCKSFHLNGGNLIGIAPADAYSTYAIAFDSNNKLRLTLTAGGSSIYSISCKK